MNGAASSNAYPSGVQGVCPTGWHVPSDAEWNAMERYLDNTVDTTASNSWTGTDIGNQLKESGTSHWYSGNNGSNSSGFTALPGGYRSSDGSFANVGSNGYWWTSTAYDASSAWKRRLNYNYTNVNKSYYNKAYGFSVRCIKDN